MELNEMKQAVISALEDIKAKDITVMDVSKMTSLCNYMIVATGESNRQTKALAGNVQVKLKALGATIYGVEGEQTGEWVLVDLGDIVVHVMIPSSREYYNLEQLWGAAEDRRKKVEDTKP